MLVTSRFWSLGSFHKEEEENPKGGIWKKEGLFVYSKMHIHKLS